MSRYQNTSFTCQLGKGVQLEPFKESIRAYFPKGIVILDGPATGDRGFILWISGDIMEDFGSRWDELCKSQGVICEHRFESISRWLRRWISEGNPIRQSWIEIKV